MLSVETDKDPVRLAPFFQGGKPRNLAAVFLNADLWHRLRELIVFMCKVGHVFSFFPERRGGGGGKPNVALLRSDLGNVNEAGSCT